MKVEHTTIGSRLSTLEETLGAPLVLRGPKGLRLTPLGDAVVPLVEQVEQAVAAVRELASARRARVRLAVPSGWTTLFTSRVASLQAGHPKLSLEFVSGAHPADLKKGEADLAVRVGTIADKELIARNGRLITVRASSTNMVSGVRAAFRGKLQYLPRQTFHEPSANCGSL